MILPYKTGTAVRVTSPYGTRVDPITGEQGAWHGGFDLVGDGDKTIRAVVSGVVWMSRIVTDPKNRTSEWGNYICISGEDGTLYYYCHLAERLVSVGERVEVGQIIGVEGSTGRSKGSHLHFEVRRLGVQINPADILGIPNMCGTYRVYEERNEEDEIMLEVNDKRQNDSEPAEWAREAVEWAVENGIIFGDENGDLMLRQPCTREQMLVFLHRFAELMEKA